MTDAKIEVPILWAPDVKSYSMEKTLMLENIEGKRRSGWQRIRWLNSIIDSMDMNLSKLQETVKDREACLLQSMGWQRVRYNLVTEALQAPLSFTISRSLLRFMSIESVILSNHFILCCPFLLLPSIFPSIRVFSNESTLRSRWPNYWTFTFSISPFNEY